MQKSLAKNSIFYLIYNVLNVAFPFLTGIYVSHVLLPESIGTVAAAQNLAQYFVILAFLGIPTYGLREISKARNDIAERDKVFSELFIINFISTIMFLIIYVFVIISIYEYRENIILYFVVGIAIALNVFNIGWLYEGLEEFKFISLRNIVFKALSFGFLVVFVRTERDTILYALVSVVGTAGNYLVNMVCSNRFVKFSFAKLNLGRHMKSIMYLVVVNLSIELYSLLDVTMMNFLCEKDSIAYYKYGRSIEAILLQIINTFTMVLVPRISFYYKEKEFYKFNKLLSKCLTIIIICALPMIVGVYFTSDFLMVALYGESYIASAMILRVLSLLLIISPVGYLLGSRVFLVSGHENMMIYPVGVGAIINIIGNAIMIPRFAEMGAAQASVISEVFVMAIYVILGKKYYKLEKIGDSAIKAIIASMAIAIYLFFVDNVNLNGWFIVSLQIVGSVIIYCLILLILNEKVSKEYFDMFLHKIKKI